MDQLSDESLRAQLKAFGEDVGPLNNSTRSYWKKNLDKLMSKHCVSPIECVSDKRRSQQCRSVRNKTSYCSADEDSNYEDLSTSDVEMNSFLTDSPGSTPFPAKRKKYSSPSKKRMNDSGTPGSSGSYNSRNRNVKHARWNNRVNTKKPTQIQQRDKELRDKLKGFGIRIDAGPLNDATRNMWQKKLNILISEASQNFDCEQSPYQNHSSVDDWKNIEPRFSEENLSSEMDVFRTTPIRRRNRIPKMKRYRKKHGEKYQDGTDNSTNKNRFIQNLMHVAIYFFGSFKLISSLFLRGVVYVLSIIAFSFIILFIIALIHRTAFENEDKNSIISSMPRAKEEHSLLSL